MGATPRPLAGESPGAIRGVKSYWVLSPRDRLNSVRPRTDPIQSNSGAVSRHLLNMRLLILRMTNRHDFEDKTSRKRTQNAGRIGRKKAGYAHGFRDGNSSGTNPLHL